jgi:glycosyltransferase involved in cell wall biosynthesis
MKTSGLEFEVIYMASGSTTRHEEKAKLSRDLYRYQLAHDGPYQAVASNVRARFSWKALSRIRPEVVIISGYQHLECWVAWLWALVHERKIILWCESNEFDFPRYWIRELPKRLFLSRCDRGHVYGASNKAYLAKLGMAPEYIESRRAVVDPKFFVTPEQKLYSTGAAKRLIYVGRLAAEKNLSTLFRALAKTAQTRGGDPGLRLIIAGTGPLDLHLRHECAQLGVDGIVEFLGYCPQKDLPSLFRTADFCVLPSTREPWGLVALEAMLSRVPILVSTRCGCAADLVMPGTGWTFSPWDEDELARLLMQLPEISAGEVARMGSKAQSVASSYSPEIAAGLVQRLVEDLAANDSTHLLAAPQYESAQQKDDG